MSPIKFTLNAKKIKIGGSQYILVELPPIISICTLSVIKIVLKCKINNGLNLFYLSYAYVMKNNDLVNLWVESF